MTKSIWKEVKGPSAGLVQQHLVGARQEARLTRVRAADGRCRINADRNVTVPSTDTGFARHRVAD